MKFSVRVKPGASRTKVGGSYGDPPVLFVAVCEQPTDGQANKAVIRALAAAFNAPRASFQVVSGHKNRTKILEFMSPDEGAARAQIENLLLS